MYLPEPARRVCGVPLFIRMTEKGFDRYGVIFELNDRVGTEHKKQILFKDRMDASAKNPCHVCGYTRMILFPFRTSE